MAPPGAGGGAASGLGNVLAQWQERWFTLKRGGAMLVYHASEADAAKRRPALGALHLEGCLLQRSPPEAGGSDGGAAAFAFALVAEQRRLTLRASDASEMERWIKAVLSSGARDMTDDEAEEDRSAAAAAAAATRRTSSISRLLSTSLAPGPSAEMVAASAAAALSEEGDDEEEAKDLVTFSATYFVVRMHRVEGLFGIALTEQNRLTAVKPGGGGDAARLQPWDRIVSLEGVALSGRIVDVVGVKKESVLIGVERPCAEAFGAIVEFESDPQNGAYPHLRTVKSAI